MAHCPDYIVEAATGDALKHIAEPSLRAGCDVIALSVGALADEDFAARIERVTRQTGRKLHVASGAIGGFDLMRTAKLAGALTCRVVNLKSPQALDGADYLKDHPLSDLEETIFEGSAQEAIAAFPKNVNVAVAAAIATCGVADTQVVVRSVPGLALNTHRIELEGDFGHATIEVASAPSPNNPRSSAIAADSVVARLQSLAAGIVY